jgi:hypothetical protein
VPPQRWEHTCSGGITRKPVCWKWKAKVEGLLEHGKKYPRTDIVEFISHGKDGKFHFERIGNTEQIKADDKNDLTLFWIDTVAF